MTTTQNNDVAREAGQTLRRMTRLSRGGVELAAEYDDAGRTADLLLAGRSNPAAQVELAGAENALAACIAISAGDSVRVRASAGAQYTGLRGVASRLVGQAWEIALTDGNKLTIAALHLTRLA